VRGQSGEGKAGKAKRNAESGKRGRQSGEGKAEIGKRKSETGSEGEEGKAKRGRQSGEGKAESGKWELCLLLGARDQAFRAG